MHCWLNVLSWYTNHGYSRICSKTLCSHFSGQGSYYSYTHAWTKLYNEVTSCIMDSHCAASVLGAGPLLSCFHRSFGIYFSLHLQASFSVRELKLIQYVKSWSCPARNQCLWCVAPCGASWSARWLTTNSVGPPWTQATRDRDWLMGPTLTISWMMSSPPTSSSKSSSRLTWNSIRYIAS